MFQKMFFILNLKLMSSVVKINQKNNSNIDVDKLENFTRDIFKNKRKLISNVLPITKNKK